ncbi:uncharacterized protein LOC126910496 [Daktulosphaira vitifoliae]|uniref:uncharacterized protein LOC126910496 n=1 Tax=Daktulosphaira vitifoliae TaxID=58002 RepID=UPI0021AA62ED|nr:uncharacterized protein LOC126910496 [Daktulosphaira vitifoliae]
MDQLIVTLLSTFHNGQWLSIIAHVKNYYKKLYYDNPERLKCASFVQEFRSQLIWSFAIGYGIYFSCCGYLEWSYSVRRQSQTVEWKCQPNKWLTWQLYLDQIKWGVVGLACTNIVSALFATNFTCGGYSTLYLEFNSYSWIWWILQWPIIFLYQDYTTYWIHRMYHSRFLFVNFHYLHHRYYQPTSWSVTALHPVEILTLQASSMLPVFVIPVHWLSFSLIILYNYYHGIIQHSGINLKPFWWQPWQPDVMFHDLHHKYVNVNFGFNCYIWDQIHDSIKK